MRVVQQPEAHVKTLQKLIADERKKAEAAKNQFTAPSDDQLIAKLRNANSPMITWQSWSSSAPVGGTISYTVGIYNPDPITHIWLFAHVFVGAPANVVASPGEALALVDQRFPRLTEPKFFGLQLAPGGSASLAYAIKVPNVDKSNYLGSTFLFQPDWHDVGTYIDRSTFVFQVT